MTIRREGVSYTDEGALNVSLGGSGSSTLPSGLTIPSPILTGAITGTATGVPFVHAKWVVPVAIASSGSIGNNGALTGHTAFPRTLSGGLYLYFPANAIAAGVAAGFYWTVMSSTTAGTIYNSTYTTGTPVAGTLTAFATTGPGAYTGVITEQGVTIALPALPAGAQQRITTLWETNGAANAKNMRIRLGGAAGTAYLSQNMAGNPSCIDERRIISVTNALQLGQTGASAGGGPDGVQGVVPVTSTVDTSVASSLVFSMEHTTATDWQMLSMGAIEIMY